MKVFFRAAALAVVLSACQRAPAAMAPEPVPAGEAPRPDGSGGASAPPAAQPLAPPGQAYQLGWMPLVSTNVPAFLSAHPEWNGHGVLIAVLDGGVEPVPGLDRLPDGSPKILDIRDFSGEGRIVLSPVIPSGDSVRVGGAVLGGAGRIRVLHTDGPIYGGELREFDLGQLPAADINGNGRLGDILPVLVVRLSDGWAVLTDSDGDGSLAGERPIRDYARGGEFLAWSGKARPAPLSVAVNLADGGPAQPPALDLVFDTSGHGTHVAGIAAGNALYGVSGFNGVAPGASLLALKIANDARGGITVTGSMVQAVDYAIRYAGARRMPLVINLSYGVGNEGEGRARIDGMLDSVLAAHPEVVMTISAGNDGPGISTLGFPASATRAIAVGATYPGAFLPLQPNGRRFDDQVAFFSARGGELARPDLLAPGMAYSTVPPWDVGEEVKNGTSMAAPHVAGLAALLLSGLSASDSPWDGGTIRRALMASARTLPGATVLDQGAGLVDVYRAWTLLSDGSQGRHPDIVVSTAPGTSAVLIGPRDSLPVDTVVTFTLSSTGSDKGGASSEISYRLRPDVPWLKAPATVRIGNRPVEVGVRIAAAPALPGAHVGVVEGWGPDSTLGPAFRLVATLAVSSPPPADSSQLSFRLAAGTLRRTFIRADSGRGFEVEVSEPRGAPLLAFLHEPGGMPWRGGAAAMVTAPDSAAVFSVDGRDVVPGTYELVTMAGPVAPVDARVWLAGSPVTVSLQRNGDTVRVRARNPGTQPATVSLDVELIGEERAVVTAGRGSADRTIPFTLPSWARRVVVELRLDRDQWPRFTDFGLTLRDADGRQLGTAPMNYAVGLLEVDLPGDRPTGQADVILSPGFAEPGAADRWEGRLAIRVYGEAPVAVPLPDSGPLTVAPGQAVETVLMLPPLPWVLGDGFFPLSRVHVRSGDRTWSRESGLPNQLPPIMP